MLKGDLVEIIGEDGYHPPQVALIDLVSFEGFWRGELQAPHSGTVYFHCEDVIQTDDLTLAVEERFVER